jgi:hypothetical protein
MSTQLVPVGDIERMALAVAKSNLFGLKTPEQAMALMLVAQAEGLHPASAARDYHIIQGQPALRSDAMLARFQAAGGSVKWKDYTDDKVCGIFSHPSGGSIEITWDMARAKQAGLGAKDNWRKFPRQMLAARCISEGVKRVYPGVAVGTYTPEEVQDFESHRPPEREVVGERIDKPAVGRVQLEGEIDRATTVQALEDLVPMIQALPSEDQNALRSRYAAQKHRIKSKREPATDNWGDEIDFSKDEAA